MLQSMAKRNDLPASEDARLVAKGRLSNGDPSALAVRNLAVRYLYRVSPGNRDSSCSATRRDDAFSRIFIAPAARGKLRLQWNSLYSRCHARRSTPMLPCDDRACVLADWNNTRELKRCNHDRAKGRLVYCAPAHTCSFTPDSGSDKQINLAIMLITKTYVVQR